jgi:LacI family transcriptional regulator
MVAEAAGVHPSTVSRALDPARRHLIGNDVLSKVEETARALGYQRNIAAAALRTGRSGMVGVILPDVANPVFGPILAGVEEALGREGCSAIVANAGGSAARALEAVRRLAARSVDGIVLAAAELEDAVVSFCLEAALPIVLVNRAEARQRTPSVISDDRAGMALAVRHLRDLGHRRIGHLAGPQTVSTGLWRREGFERAMGEGGRSPIAVATSYDREEGARAADRLLAEDGLTAIACANDLLALGAVAAARQRGLRCPADISIIGYNDMPLIDIVDPPLTSIRISSEEMGRAAGLRLLRAFAGEAGGHDRTVVAPVLVIRGSTAPPRG